MTPAPWDPPALTRWRSSIRLIMEGGRQLLAPLRSHPEARSRNVDIDVEAAGITAAAVLRWAVNHPEEAAWWAEHLAEWGRKHAEIAYGMTPLQFDQADYEQGQEIYELLRIEEEWR